MSDSYIPVIDNFFYIDYASNTGAAFSLLSNHSIMLILLTIVICVMIYHMMYSYKDNRLNNIAFGILFGGILGNFLDRVFVGYVRDFISFKFGNYYFPTFNIADAAIVVGVILVIISTIIEERCKNGNKSRRSKRKKTR
jgi:signal peptidase II